MARSAQRKAPLWRSPWLSALRSPPPPRRPMVPVAPPAAAAAAGSGAAAAPAAATPLPTLEPGPRWSLTRQIIHVSLDLRARSLHGTVQLFIQLPREGAAPADIRLHCASTCQVHRCLVDGAQVTHRLADDELIEEVVVPDQWRHTRDLASYRRCHGAATFLASHQYWDEPSSGRCFHNGQLIIPLSTVASTTAASSDLASGGAAASAKSTEAPSLAGGRMVTVQVEFVAADPRGGVHFARRHGGVNAEVAYAHTVSEAGAARRWMPCVDCVQVRCPVQLHVTADAGLQVHASGRPLVGLANGDVEAGAVEAAGSAPSSSTRRPRLRTWSFAIDQPVTASQIGFVVGKLSSLPHPTLPRVALALGSLATDESTNGGDGASADAMWPQMLYLARQLPSLFQCLRSDLLGPSAAVAAEAALAEEDAEEAAAESGTVRPIAPGRLPSALRRHPSHVLQPKAWRGEGREDGDPSGGEKAEDYALTDPFDHHTIVALEGCFEETAAFAGLVLVSAHLLHPPEVVEPARPLRLALGRAIGRSWLCSGLWLASWRDAWLLMALEGRLVHGLVAHEFGVDEANHRLAEERRELCRSSTGDASVALVPDDRELERWGGGLHPEQLFCAHRARKAPLVWRMLEGAVGRTDGGTKAFTRILARLLVFPPGGSAAHGRGGRIRSTEGLLTACIAAGAKLGTLPSEWIFSAKPCPTLRANFAYNESQHKVELVLVQQQPAEAAQLGELPLNVGWGEPDGEGALACTKNPPVSLNPVERHQLVELTVSLHRRRRRKRVRADTAGDEDESRGTISSDLSLLWVRIDPDMELPLRVHWTGRSDEPRWNGLPEAMCKEQLVHDRQVASRLEAAAALATFKTQSAIDALAACVRDPEVFFRVRVAAAAALGSISDSASSAAAVRVLIKHVRDSHFERCYLKPNDFSEIGEYAVLKATVEAIGTCRDAGGYSPTEACELLVELLDHNDNSSNAFADDYYLGALLRALAATRGAQAGYPRTVVERVSRLLRIDRVRKTHERVLTRAALQALVTIDLERSRRVHERRAAIDEEDEEADQIGGGGGGGGVEVSWATYWHCEQHGECASLRLAAADCLLRLSLLLAPAEVPFSECRPVLALAHRLAAARNHAPLEQLWMWSALLGLLSDPSHAEAVQRERERLEVWGDDAALAAVQLLWHGMTVGSAGHTRLRYVLCDVWSCLFGDETPSCLPFKPQPIGCEQLAAMPDGFVPLHAMRRRRRDAVAARRALLQPKASLKMKLHINNAAGMITQWDMTSGAEAEAAAARQPANVRFVSESVAAEKLAEILPALENEYRERAEKWVKFLNNFLNPNPVATGGGAGRGAPPGT